MEYVYAALTAHEADGDVDEETLTAILEAAGVEVNESRVQAIVRVREVLEAGQEFGASGETEGADAEIAERLKTARIPPEHSGGGLVMSHATPQDAPEVETTHDGTTASSSTSPEDRPDPGAMRGMLADETDKSARELLEEARDEDERRHERLLDRNE